LKEPAAATRAKPENLGETRREIRLAPPQRTISFLHMGFGFRRNSDIWQVIQGAKCKKTSIQREKYKNSSFSVQLALQ
jgi:hypothetical protein